MKINRYIIIFIMGCFSLLMGGCNLPLQKTQTGEMVLTSAAETVNAELTQLPSSKTVTPTTGPTTTSTQVAIIPSTATLVPSTATAIPCNWGKFMSENLPDNSQVISNTEFEKRWMIKNIGSCTWTSGYRVVFDHGDRMQAPSSIPFSDFSGNAVQPGQVIEIKVPLKAPESAGTYQGYFYLQSSDGIIFGLGSHADENFWVKVSVKEQTSTPTFTQTYTATASNTPVLTPTATNTIIPMPDLTIIDFSLDEDTYSIGQPVMARVSIVNQGPVNAGSFTVKWIPDISHNDQAQYQNVDFLNSQEGVVLNFNLPGGYTEARNFTSKILIDIDNMVIENNEANNDQITTASCTP